MRPFRSNERLLPRSISCSSVAFLLLLSACSSSGDPEVAASSSSSDGAEVAEDSASVTSESEGDNAGSSSIGSLSAGSQYLGSYDLVDDEFGTIVTVTVEGSTRTIEANALPDHDTGEFPNAGNPNTITEQDVSYSYTTEPTFTGGAAGVRTTGVALNGVKFEPGTAETVSCSSGETLRVEALQDVYNLGLDFNNAHVQPTGEYHYHGVSDMLVDAYASDEDLVLVGFAADGFLMYYSKSGAYESSYVLSQDARVGSDCTASGPAGGTSVEIAGSTPDGTYTSDYAFDAAAGDLDVCNGIVVDGEYVYLITDSYPFVGRCLNGETGGSSGQSVPQEGAAPDDASGQDGGPVQPTGGPSGEQPNLSEAAAELGVTEAQLQAALGGPPPDFEAAAETLGVSVQELRAVLPGPGGQG